MIAIFLEMESIYTLDILPIFWYPSFLIKESMEGVASSLQAVQQQLRFRKIAGTVEQKLENRPMKEELEETNIMLKGKNKRRRRIYNMDEYPESKTE